MDTSKLTHLQQIHIPTPCPESWEAMDGDSRQRFCAGCGCFVHNISEVPAEEAEAMLAGTDKVCTRLTLDEKKGVLTRDGWIPRLLLAGAVAASLSGFTDAESQTADPAGKRAPVTQGEILGESPKPVPPYQVKLGEAARTQEAVLLGKPAPPEPPAILGRPAAPIKPKPLPTKPTAKPGKSSKPVKATKATKPSKKKK